MRDCVVLLLGHLIQYRVHDGKRGRRLLMLRRYPAWGVNRVQRRMLAVLTLLLVLQKRSLVARRDRLRMFDWHVSRHKLVLVRIRTFIGLIACC